MRKMKHCGLCFDDVAISHLREHTRCSPTKAMVNAYFLQKGAILLEMAPFDQIQSTVSRVKEYWFSVRKYACLMVA